MSTPPDPQPLPSDLTTLTNVKAWLNVTTDTSDATLQRLLSAASQFVQTYLNRNIALQAYSEVYTGSGSDTQALANYPIQSVDSVSIRGNPIRQSPDGIQYGYTFDDRFLYLIGMPGPGPWISSAPAQFPKFPIKGVAVSYSAGYESTPLDLEQATLELIGLKWADRNHFGQSSKSVGGEVVSYVTMAMPNSVSMILGNYKKVVPV